MSLSDDQILKDEDNALDKLGKSINSESNVLGAIKAVTVFEENLAKAKNLETKDGKTVIDPEMKQKINQEALIQGIREEMEMDR